MDTPTRRKCGTDPSCSRCKGEGTVPLPASLGGSHHACPVCFPPRTDAERDLWRACERIAELETAARGVLLDASRHEMPPGLWGVPAERLKALRAALPPAARPAAPVTVDWHPGEEDPAAQIAPAAQKALSPSERERAQSEGLTLYRCGACGYETMAKETPNTLFCPECAGDSGRDEVMWAQPWSDAAAQKGEP